MLTAALLTLAAVAGATGTWSPCGLSMVATIGPGGHAGGRRATLASCATFALGAVAAGGVLFAALAGAGALSQSLTGGTLLAVVGALVAAAAVAELAGARVSPQVRRQVPEHWRRALPLPVAAGLYGVLLGLGFTTFVYTYAVWALAALCAGLGDPVLGAAAGAAFGAGRALPVVVLAPLSDRPIGARAIDALAERPGLLRGARVADGLALALCALAVAAPPALAASRVATGAADPTAAGEDLAWHVPGGPGVLVRGASSLSLPGSDPAAGGPNVAWREGSDLVVARRADLTTLARVPAPGADKLAVSERWLAWRARDPAGRDVLLVRLIEGGPTTPVVTAPAGTTLGRPALDGDQLAWAESSPRASSIALLDLASGRERTLRRGRGVLVHSPALLDGALLYVRTSSRTQQLRLAAPGTRERVLYRMAGTARRDRGHEPGRQMHRRPFRVRTPRPQSPRVLRTLWTTALAPRFAYVTRLTSRRGRTTYELLRVPR